MGAAAHESRYANPAFQSMQQNNRYQTPDLDVESIVSGRQGKSGSNPKRPRRIADPAQALRRYRNET